MRNAFFLILALVVVSTQALAQSVGASPDPKDPQYQAKGDQHRTYAFQAGDIQQYRLYVPSRWTKDVKLPLLVLLSPGENADVPWLRGNGEWVKIAEQRGYIVVTPSGYRPKAAPAGWRPRYNSPFGVVPIGGKPSVYDRDPRSEQDVLNVTDLVAQEYNVDRSRIYLFSNSHSGAGVWYLGQKYPERWAAISMASAGIAPDDYPFDRLKPVPVLVLHGTHDETMSYDAAFAMARAAKAKGVNSEFMPIPGGTHLESWTSSTAFNKILDFFDKHRKR